MRHNVLIFIITLLACCFACNNSEKPKAETQEKSIAVSADTSHINTPTPVTKDPKASIIGRWQSTADKNEVWEFTDGYLKIYHEGKLLSEEKYGINDKCAEGVTTAPEAEKYISTYDGLCYYMVKMDASNLELSFVGRGNTLSFTRIQ